ncbi:hypothetical protein BDZ45DRAFT_745199 [Acephala macrosclerotiorum]|nr:hypothetical protein BDZ45DRAFT_745199 [Acephala macrosclerotiorum]
MHFAVVSLLIGLARAICPGFDYAFFHITYDGTIDPNFVGDGKTLWEWIITDDDCRLAVDACYKGTNPCSQCDGMGCSAALDVHVDKVVVHGLWYLCRRDPNSGSCPTVWIDTSFLATFSPPTPVESCCRNDGKRNLELGLISEREYQAIEDTNAMLDTHKHDYEHALATGKNVTALREIQRRELKDAKKMQLAARWADIDLV